MKNKIINWFLVKEPNLMKEFMNTNERLDYHPEGNTWDHLMLVFDAANNERSLNEWGPMEDVDWLVLVLHDLGKPLTGGERPYEDGNQFCLLNKSHKGHDDLGVEEIDRFFAKKRKERNDDLWSWSESDELLCKTLSKFHQRVHGIEKCSTLSIINLVKEMMEFTGWDLKSNKWNKIWRACQSDARGRLGFESIDYHQASIMKVVINEMIAWDNEGKYEFVKKKEMLKTIKHEEFKKIKNNDPDTKDELIWKNVSLIFKNHPFELELNLTQKISEKIKDLQLIGANEVRFKNKIK